MRKFSFAGLITFLNMAYPGKQRIDNISYAQGPLHKYDEYPATDIDAPLVLFWYGGGWKSGQKEMYRYLGHKLQAMGAHAFIIDYPKFPEVKYPAFTSDALLAINHIKKVYPGKKVVLMGHSAGANTVAILGLGAKKIADKVITISLPCYLPIKHWRPVFGEAMEKGLHDPRSYVGGANPRTEFLLIHGRADPIVSYKDSVSLFNMLKKRGHKCQLILLKSLEHSVIIFIVFLGPYKKTRQAISNFINS